MASNPKKAGTPAHPGRGEGTQLNWLLIAAVGLLSYANGANDNFKGVATLWGAGSTTYKRALAVATTFTFSGSLAAIGAASGLVSKFNGSQFVGAAISARLSFLAAVALGAAATVLLASRLGLPVSTTHALTGALGGAGLIAAGISGVNFAALGSGVILPLILSPVLSLCLTVVAYPLVKRLAAGRDCVCVDQAQAVAVSATGEAFAESISAPTAIRWANARECATGTEVAQGSVTHGLHWFSRAAISFARGLNDTPKIAALLFVLPAGLLTGSRSNFVLVAVAVAMGGTLGAARVARTLSKQITPMTAEEAVSANLVAAALVALASLAVLPVSTTHVTSGGIFGIGLLQRRRADWKRVREIMLSWAATMPLGAACAASVCLLLTN